MTPPTEQQKLMPRPRICRNEAMKLYIWNNPYDVSYGSTYLCVVPNSENEAREVARGSKTIAYGEFQKDYCLLPDDLGPPTRVLDAPCAEVIEWSE